MERVNNLPLPAKVAAIALISAIVLYIVFTKVLAGDGMVTIKNVSSSADAFATLDTLDKGGVHGKQEFEGAGFIIRVPKEQKDQAEKLLSPVASSTIVKGEEIAKPGMTDTSGKDLYMNKVMQEQIRTVLINTPGIKNANVIYVRSRSTQLIGDDTIQVTVNLVEDHLSRCS